MLKYDVNSFSITNFIVTKFKYVQAKAATGYFKEAEELLVQINDPEIRHQPTFDMALSRCHINAGHADQVHTNT